MALEFVRASGSEGETAAIGRLLGGMLRAGDVVLLEGPLGAGKTLLVRAIAAGLGLDTASASSPTYVIVHVYPSTGKNRPSLVHVDAYRLSGQDDFVTLGLEELLQAPDAHGATPALVVEWADRLPPGSLPATQPARIRIEPTAESSRELWFTLPEDWAARPGVDELLQRRATTCPVTGRPVPPDSPTWPFADQRARSADLYRWLSESYSITGTSDPLDEE